MAKNIEMNIKTEGGYEILYPNIMAENVTVQEEDSTLDLVISNLLLVSENLSKGKANIVSESFYFTSGSVRTITIPISNGRLLFVYGPQYSQKLQFVAIYDCTQPFLIVGSENVSTWSQSCTWSSTNITFSYKPNTNATHRYVAIGIN